MSTIVKATSVACAMLAAIPPLAPSPDAAPRAPDDAVSHHTSLHWPAPYAGAGPVDGTAAKPETADLLPQQERMPMRRATMVAALPILGIVAEAQI